MKKYYCIDCNKEIKGYGKRCGSCAKKGELNPRHDKPAWNKGLTKKTDIRVKKYSQSLIGKLLTENHKRHISQSMKGKHNSPKTQFKKGQKHTEEWKKTISERMKGEGNPNFINGQSSRSYPLEFNQELKEFIRKRDNYTCQNCGITEEEYIIIYGFVLEVHHIDYNKQNCNKENLITLCLKCNIRANFNREYWRDYYQCKIIKQLF